MKKKRTTKAVKAWAICRKSFWVCNERGHADVFRSRNEASAHAMQHVNRPYRIIPVRLVPVRTAPTRKAAR